MSLVNRQIAALSIQHSELRTHNSAFSTLPLPAFRSPPVLLSVRLLYNRRMALDPANPPIWLRKLHVTAAQCTSDEYASSPEEGILRCCRLSDAVREWSQACAQALGIPPLPAPPPFDNPFHRTPLSESLASGLRTDNAAR